MLFDKNVKMGMSPATDENCIDMFLRKERKIHCVTKNLRGKNDLVRACGPSKQTSGNYNKNADVLQAIFRKEKDRVDMVTLAEMVFSLRLYNPV